MSMSEMEIRSLWNPSERIASEGDAHVIMHSFLNVSDSACYPLLQNVRLLTSFFMEREEHVRRLYS